MYFSHHVFTKTEKKSTGDKTASQLHLWRICHSAAGLSRAGACVVGQLSQVLNSHSVLAIGPWGRHLAPLAFYILIHKMNIYLNITA